MPIFLRLQNKTFVHLEFQTLCNNLLAYNKGVFILKVDNNNALNYLTQLCVHCLKQAYPSLVYPFGTLCLKILNFVSFFLASVVICTKTFPRLAFRPTRTDLFAVWILESANGIAVFPYGAYYFPSFSDYLLLVLSCLNVAFAFR